MFVPTKRRPGYLYADETYDKMLFDMAQKLYISLAGQDCRNGYEYEEIDRRMVDAAWRKARAFFGHKTTKAFVGPPPKMRAEDYEDIGVENGKPPGSNGIWRSDQNPLGQTHSDTARKPPGSNGI